MSTFYNRVGLACAVALMLFFSLQTSFAAASGSMSGRVFDKDTHDPLPGANVQVKNTGLGASTNLDGKFVIHGVPAGNQTIVVSYIGYVKLTVDVMVPENGSLDQDFNLTAQALQGETVVVTGQAQGQVNAINQQLASNTIKNVVSEQKIQELPDVNAAEAIGRLPGVTTLRSSGEGNTVVIRGISPQYNLIAVNGIDLGSTSNQNRSVDLSMITPNMLKSIEVYKAFTPDMDADAIGGYVNMQLREAPSGLHSDLLWQSGYSKYKQDYGNYKAVAQVSDRLFDENLGIFLLGDVESVDRSADNYAAGYEKQQYNIDTTNPIYFQSLNLRRHFETRRRYGLNAIFDYKLPNGRLTLVNFFSRLGSDYTEYAINQNLDPNTNNINWTYRKGYTKTDLLTNALQGENDFGLFAVDYSISNSVTRVWDPQGYQATFLTQGPFQSAVFNPNQDPAVVAGGRNILWAQTDLQNVGYFSTQYTDRGISGVLNFKVPFTLPSFEASGFFKVGGKIRYIERNNDQNNVNPQTFYGGDAGFNLDWLALVPEMKLNYDGNTRVYAQQFAADKSLWSNFLDNKYGDIVFAPRGDMIQTIVNRLLTETNPSHPADYSRHFSAGPVELLQNDFFYMERMGSSYAMAQLNVGPRLMVVGGFRYENDDYTFTGYQMHDISNSVRTTIPYKKATTPGNNHYILPSGQAQYKLTDWADLRYAYTQTLSRPDYNYLTPAWFINTEASSITVGNPTLKPARSYNHDLIISIYSNEIGLLTIGGFYKEIDDFVYSSNYNLPSNVTALQSALYGLPAGVPLGIDHLPLQGPWINQLQFPGTSAATNATNYINNPNAAFLRGIEVDLQTRFWFLPAPFNGLILNINYTHTASVTAYPWLRSGPVFYPDTNNLRQSVPTYINTSRTNARLYNQPNDLVNIALGYDYEGFMGRVSVSYIGNMVSGVNTIRELDSQIDQFVRLDASFRQTLPVNGLSLYLNLNNINNRNDQSINTLLSYPINTNYYGFTADLGVRFQL